MSPFQTTVVCEAVADESDDSEDIIVLQMYGCVVWVVLPCGHIPMARAHRSLSDVLIRRAHNTPAMMHRVTVRGILQV